MSLAQRPLCVLKVRRETIVVQFGLELFVLHKSIPSPGHPVKRWAA